MPEHNPGIRLLILLVTVAAVVMAPRSSAYAHADLDSASPPVNGTVTALPPNLSLVFTEEVKPGAVSVTVTGPDGQRADNGGAAVDLNDPERVTVVVPMLAGGDGIYSVEWQAISNIDGDQTTGSYTFSVAEAVGSPVNTTAATPDVPANVVTVVPSVTVDSSSGGNLLTDNSNYDSRAFAISVGAGLIALAAIVGFWFLVRPRNPKFGPRSPDGQE